MSKLALFCFTAILVSACTSRQDLLILCAPSLSGVLRVEADEFGRTNPDTRVRLEIAGSQVLARRITELGLRADVVALADAEVITAMLIPKYAQWSIQIATNEIVIAHGAHSRYTNEITSENWADILTRQSVTLGTTDPDLSPLGYRTLMVWQLAQDSLRRPGLADALRAKVAPEHVMADEGELWALLSSRAVDYAFLYRSTAEAHRLKSTRLSDAINLSRPERNAEYGRATVQARWQRGGPAPTLHGAAVVAAVTIPSNSVHAEAAARFLRLALGDFGQRTLLQSGFTPLHPARASPGAVLPSALEALVEAAP
jgi:molybdate/tungstate transport system substrate-binding protein